MGGSKDEYRDFGFDGPRSVELRQWPEKTPEGIFIFDILDENGESLGFCALCLDPENPEQILISNIDIEFFSHWKNKGKGYGNLIYEKLAHVVGSLGKKFVSSGSANEYALDNWRYLVSKGIAKQDPKKARWDTGWYYVDPPATGEVSVH